MAKKARPNRIGVKGWWTGGKYGVEKKAYFLHRLTGLIIVFYLIAHIIHQGPWISWWELIVVLAFIYHAMNGIRLIITELGFGVGRPTLPSFPYVPESLVKTRPLFWILMAFSAIYIVLAIVGFAKGG